MSRATVFMGKVLFSIKPSRVHLASLLPFPDSCTFIEFHCYIKHTAHGPVCNSF